MTENIENKKEREQNCGWVRARKILMWIGIVTVIILAFLIWIGNNTNELNKKILDWQAQRYEQALQKHTDEMRARYTADTDGGETPEETIELFINALKAGDIEKASKYYVLEKQEEELRHLREGILWKYGDLQKSIDFYFEVKAKGIKSCNKKGDGCTFEYVYIDTATTTYKVTGMNQEILVPAGEKTTKSIDLELNRFSGVWKIELP